MSRVVARAQRRVVEQRVHRDDHVGLIADEEIAQALAIERLAEAHERPVAAAAVRRMVERAVDRRRVAQGHAVAEAELGQREGAVGGDVFDPGLEGLGFFVSSRAAAIALAALRWPPPVSEINRRARLVIRLSRLGSGRHPPRRTPAGIARSPARRSELTQERSSRRIVEAEDIAKLDFGVSVVAIVVLGEHDRQRAEQASQPCRGSPAQARSCGATRREAARAPVPRRRPARRPVRARRRRRDRGRRRGSRRATRPDRS